MEVLQCHLLKSKEWGAAFETLYGDKESCRQRAASWFPGCDSVTQGNACKGATRLHAGPWQQELLCLAPVTTVICCLHLLLEDTMLLSPPLFKSISECDTGTYYQLVPYLFSSSYRSSSRHTSPNFTYCFSLGQRSHMQLFISAQPLLGHIEDINLGA